MTISLWMKVKLHPHIKIYKEYQIDCETPGQARAICRVYNPTEFEITHKGGQR